MRKERSDKQGGWNVRIRRRKRCFCSRCSQRGNEPRLLLQRWVWATSRISRKLPYSTLTPRIMRSSCVVHSSNSVKGICNGSVRDRSLRWGVSKFDGRETCLLRGYIRARMARLISRRASCAVTRRIVNPYYSVENRFSYFNIERRYVKFEIAIHILVSWICLWRLDLKRILGWPPIRPTARPIGRSYTFESTLDRYFRRLRQGLVATAGRYRCGSFEYYVEQLVHIFSNVLSFVPAWNKPAPNM